MARTEKVGAVVTPQEKYAIRWLADRERRSEGDIVRLALEAYEPLRKLMEELAEEVPA